MENEILIVREDTGFRLLFGHLQLVAILSEENEVKVKVKNGNQASVMRTELGLMVHDGEVQLPLFRV